MALGKTVSYTPFNETSFGYGSNEIATAHVTEFPNATDIVKVTIEHASGNWDTTGHLATPSIGTAVATYHKLQEYWTVKGERDDVDAVLAAMSFFPADKPETRLWNPTEESHALKDNVISGNYGSTEEPPTIGNTSFSLKVYDGATQVSTQTVTFSVTEAVFGNQRPYWAVAPTVEDLNTSAHKTVAGGLLDLGTISHGTDTENVRVKCQFRHYGQSTPTTGALGAITQDENIYIGDKKPATSDNNEARFDFTGSVAEAQAFLDSVRYYDAYNQKTFDMFLTITDGVVGSTLTKTCYFSNNVVTVSTVPDVHYVEDDNPAYWDFGYLNFNYSNMTEVNTFTATITLDATGISNTSNFDTSIGSGVTQSYNSGTGVLVISSNSTVDLRRALRNLRYTPITDANDAFNMTFDFTVSNPTLGTSYSATQQIIAVTAQDVSEVSNLTTTHTWTEDKWYDFPITNIPQIIHGRNDKFDVIFTLSDANAGVLGRHLTVGTAFFTNAYGTSAQYKLQGTRNEVNEALQNLYFAPVADYNDDFTISFTVDRISGDLTYETQSTGYFTMNAIAVDEISFPLERPHITWENNVSTDFASGLQIEDTSYTLSSSPTFGSTYTVNVWLKQLVSTYSGVSMETGVLKIKDEYVDLLDVVTDNRTNYVTITGNRDAVNLALENLTFIPDPSYAEDNNHYVIYQVTRDADAVVLQNFSASVLTWIDNAIIDEGYSINAQQFNWTEDTPFEFDTQFRITEELTANADYTSDNGYDNWYGSWYKVTIRGKYWDGSNTQELAQINFTTTTAPNANLLVSGIGTVSDPLVLQGSKAELNKAFATMKMTPATLDFTNSPETNGSFWIEHKLERMRDSSNIINYNEQLGRFNAGTDTSEYRTTWTNVKYTEDIPNQYIFAHINDFIQDGAGDLFDTTYDVTIALANEVTGKFVPYVEEGYLDEDVQLFISDYAVRIVGSKDEVNASIKDIIFTPYADVADNVDIIYTQKRTYNNTVVTHADAVTVATMTGIDTPEFVYGTANNNIQYYVSNNFNKGVDLNTTNVNSAVNDPNPVRTYVDLTPRQLAENIGKIYQRPITITDLYEEGGESLYKIDFTRGSIGGDIITGTESGTSTGFQTKEDLHILLDNGLMVNQAQSTAPLNGSERTVIFTLYRMTASGVVAAIKTGVLTYKYISGLTVSQLTNDEYMTVEFYYGTASQNHPTPIYNRIDNESNRVNLANGSIVILDEKGKIPEGELSYYFFQNEFTPFRETHPYFVNGYRRLTQRDYYQGNEEVYQTYYTGDYIRFKEYNIPETGRLLLRTTNGNVIKAMEYPPNTTGYQIKDYGLRIVNNYGLELNYGSDTQSLYLDWQE